MLQILKSKKQSFEDFSKLMEYGKRRRIKTYKGEQYAKSMAKITDEKNKYDDEVIEYITEITEEIIEEITASNTINDSDAELSRKEVTEVTNNTDIDIAVSEINKEESCSVMNQNERRGTILNKSLTSAVPTEIIKNVKEIEKEDSDILLTDDMNTIKLMENYAQVIMEDDNFNCIDVEELKLTINNLTEKIDDMNEEIKFKQEKINLLEENLEHFLDENVRLKNNIKFLKERHRNQSESTIYSDEDEDTSFKNYQQDYLDFKKYVLEELSTIKQQNIHRNQQPSNDEQFQDEIFQNEDEYKDNNNNKENMPIKKKITRSKSFPNIRKTAVEDVQNITENMTHITPGMAEMNKNIAPGVKTWNKAHLRTTLIISDSTISRIPAWQLKENIDQDTEKVITKRHPGSTADEISFFSKKTLNDIRPDQLIIIAGTNDISRGLRDTTLNEFKIVDDILDIGRSATQVGTKKVFISSILVRSRNQYTYTITRVNNLLEKMCNEQGFIFLDNSDITNRHISRDGLHPNKYGCTILKMNILKCFLSFNPYIFCNFDDLYNEALF